MVRRPFRVFILFSSSMRAIRAPYNAFMVTWVQCADNSPFSSSSGGAGLYLCLLAVSTFLSVTLSILANSQYRTTHWSKNCFISYSHTFTVTFSDRTALASSSCLRLVISLRTTASFWPCFLLTSFGLRPHSIAQCFVAIGHQFGIFFACI